MLSSHERRRFNEIIAGLLAEDPGFSTRHDAPPRNLRPRPILALMLWLSMPFMISLGGWTGLLVACVAAAYGAHLWFRGRSAQSGQPPGQPETGD